MVNAAHKSERYKAMIDNLKASLKDPKKSSAAEKIELKEKHRGENQSCGVRQGNSNGLCLIRYERREISLQH